MRCRRPLRRPSRSDAPTAAAIQLHLPDGPASTTRRGTDCDGDSTPSPARVVVDLANVAPRHGHDRPGLRQRGHASTTFTTSARPPIRVPTRPFAVSVDCRGCGTQAVTTLQLHASAGLASALPATPSPTVPPTTTVTVIVIDADAANDTATLHREVANVAPTVAFTGGPVTVSEGVAEVHLQLLDQRSGGDTVALGHAQLRDGRQLCRAGRLQHAHLRAASSARSPTARPARPSPSRSTDSDGAPATPRPAVTVDNVAPTVPDRAQVVGRRSRPTPTASRSPIRAWTPSRSLPATRPAVTTARSWPARW